MSRDETKKNYNTPYRDIFLYMSHSQLCGMIVAGTIIALVPGFFASWFITYPTFQSLWDYLIIFLVFSFGCFIVWGCLIFYFQFNFDNNLRYYTAVLPFIFLGVLLGWWIGKYLFLSFTDPDITFCVNFLWIIGFFIISIYILDTQFGNVDENRKRFEESLLGLDDRELKKLLNHPREYIRSLTLWAYGKRGDLGTFQIILKRLSDKSWAIRSSAARALGNLGDQRAIEHLIGRLHDHSEYVRESAAKALGKLGNSKAFDPLVETLKDKNVEVRSAAVFALVALGKPEAVEPIMDYITHYELYNRLQDSSTKFFNPRYYKGRADAIKALGILNDRRSLGVLNKLLEDKDRNIREAAREALKKLTSTPEGQSPNTPAAHPLKPE